MGDRFNVLVAMIYTTNVQNLEIRLSKLSAPPSPFPSSPNARERDGVRGPSLVAAMPPYALWEF